jgi:hypothetical protein
MLGGQVVLSIEDLGSEGKLIADGRTVDLLLGDTIFEKIKHEFDPEDPKSMFAKMKDDMPEITEQIKQLLSKDVPEITEQVKQILGKDFPEIAEQVKQVITKVDSALDTTQSTLTNIEAYTKDERIDKIVGNLNKVSSNLKLTSEEVRRAPWKLLYKPKPNEYKIQALVDSAGAFATGAENLDNTVLRLQRLVIEADGKFVDKERIEAVIAELQNSFEQYQKAETEFWQQLE